MNPETDSEDELPPGWEERATIDGQVYYANHLVKSTQWTHPRTGKRKTVSGSLPFGWEQRHLPDNKILYVNHQEEKTSYVDPRLAFAKEIVDPGDGLKDFRQRFDASSNALQVLHGQDLSQKIAIVTGGNSGIGFETARTLARAGCLVILACRSLSKAESSVADILEERPHAKCKALHLDLTSLASVEAFHAEFQKQFSKLDILILNAGIFGVDQRTQDGLESTFQVNYLSQFYLANLLKPLLMKSTMPKMVTLSSESHRFSLKTESADFMHLSAASNHSTYAYNDSKLFQLMFVLQADTLWDKIHCIAVHPGNMVCSGLTRHWWPYKFIFNLVRPFMKSLQQAAASVIFATAAPEMNYVGGIYVNNCVPCQPSQVAQNQKFRHILWQTSLRILQDKGYIVK